MEFPAGEPHGFCLPAPAARRKMKPLKMVWGVLLLILFLVNCSGKGKAVNTLPPADKQFLSEARYIISKKEIKIFKNTPAEEREKFIEEFWKQRDPSPSTEENEFRDEYYRRIEQANHLFREGSSGWLSDRGRMYILLGEPERRDVFPSGYSFYEPPVEIWYYGGFPVVFIDNNREGIYRLEPGSVRRLSMINAAQQQLKPEGINRNVRQFDFALTMVYRGSGEAKLLMEVPYRVVNLIQNNKTGAYETQLKLSVNISGPKGKKVLEKEALHSVTVSEDKLAKLGKSFTIEFPFQLSAGKYTAQVTMENTADRSQARKKIDFKL